MRNCAEPTEAKEGKSGRSSGLALLWAVWWATNALLEAEAPVRKLGKELRLEKDMQVVHTPLALGLADRWENGIISKRS